MGTFNKFIMDRCPDRIITPIMFSLKAMLLNMDGPLKGQCHGEFGLFLIKLMLQIQYLNYTYLQNNTTVKTMLTVTSLLWTVPMATEDTKIHTIPTSIIGTPVYNVDISIIQTPV